MTDPARTLLAGADQLRSPPWLKSLREAAAHRFAQVGLPTTRDEEWRYTNLASLAQVRFERARRDGPGGVTPARVEQVAGATGAIRLVFVNGHFQATLSSVPALPAGIHVGSLAAALAEKRELIEPHLARLASAEANPLVALNTAFVEDGALVHLAPGALLPAPIHLAFISSAAGRPAASHPRNLIVAGAGNHAAIVETYAGERDHVYFTNAVTEVALGPGAAVQHYKLQQESERAFHIAHIEVHHERDSRFVSHSVAVGSALARTDLRDVLGAPGAECSLNGLYVGAGRQHLDNRTAIDHKAAHCTSRELYKGVLDGQSRGVFSGRILVRPDAQKTDAQQTNKNLLLSEEALVDTKPQLEIFADDVKCSHGAAVGELDEDAIFYLRSRGVPREAARSLLTWAFASEMVGLIPIEPLRDRVRELVMARLPGRERLEAV